MSDGDRCAACRFYRPTYSGRGACHRRAPTRSSGPDQFPAVRDDAWCGEFEGENTLVAAYPAGDDEVPQPSAPVHRLIGEDVREAAVELDSIIRPRLPALFQDHDTAGSILAHAAALASVSRPIGFVSAASGLSGNGQSHVLAPEEATTRGAALPEPDEAPALPDTFSHSPKLTDTERLADIRHKMAAARRDKQAERARQDAELLAPMSAAEVRRLSPEAMEARQAAQRRLYGKRNVAKRKERRALVAAPAGPRPRVALPASPSERAKLDEVLTAPIARAALLALSPADRKARREAKNRVAARRHLARRKRKELGENV